MQETSLPAITAKTHAAVLIPILLLAALLYAPVVGTYYCGFDDMIELHRLSFLKQPDVWSDFSTVLYESNKYRPLSWVMNRWTFDGGEASAAVFRFRNVGFHAANVALLYGIVFLMFRSRAPAAVAAVLFAAHPFVNQSVVGGLWTVTPCDFLFLLALFLFLMGVVRGGGLGWITGSMIAATLGLLGYDAVMPVFGLTFVYLALRWLAGRKFPVPWRFAVALVLLTLAGNALYFTLRAKFVPPGRPLQPASLSMIVKNSLIYAGSPWLAVDPVLLNRVLDTPLPREISAGARPPAAWWLLTLGPLVVVALLLMLRARQTVERLKTLEWPEVVFCVVAVVASFSPFVVFTDHASETYMYLPMAFSTALFGRLLWLFLGGSRAFVPVLVSLLASYCVATVVRNHAVSECGQAVRNIFQGLPLEMKQGQWRVYMANDPLQARSRPYGMYGYRGVHVLGIGRYGAPGLEAGLRFATGNRQIAASEVTADEVNQLCRNGQPAGVMCLLVDADGMVHRVPAW